jgi:hypothetical protein
MQQSVVTLHTKVDQVGIQLATASTLQQQAYQLQLQQQQQQHQVAIAPMNAFAYANPNALFNPQQPSPIMNSNNVLLAFQQQQQQMLQFQQQQQQNPYFNPMLNNNNNNNMLTLTPSFNNGINNNASNNNNNNIVKLKTEELISTLNFIVHEYENLKSSVSTNNYGGVNNALSNSSSGLNSSKEKKELEDTIFSLKTSVNKLEEKNETLQVFYFFLLLLLLLLLLL